MMQTFEEENFHALCDALALKDTDLQGVIVTHGYPPFWSRTPTLATLVQIILEQQVSLASAKAAFVKLQEKIGHITPGKILLLTDEELQACYFSRQKIKYVKHLATAVLAGTLIIEQLGGMPNEQIRQVLKKITGIGDWTVDVFLMMVLHRTDVLPPGDIALMKSIKEIKRLPIDTPKTELLAIAEHWKPYRTVAAYLLWHAYLAKRKLKN